MNLPGSCLCARRKRWCSSLKACSGASRSSAAVARYRQRPESRRQYSYHRYYRCRCGALERSCSHIPRLVPEDRCTAHEGQNFSTIALISPLPSPSSSSALSLSSLLSSSLSPSSSSSSSSADSEASPSENVPTSIAVPGAECACHRHCWRRCRRPLHLRAHPHHVNISAIMSCCRITADDCSHNPALSLMLIRLLGRFAVLACCRLSDASALA